MNEVLKIEVQAQVAQAQAALRQLQTSLKGTEQAATGTTKALPKLGNASNQATFALTNLGRVASDAPFGIIGLANNIEPLIQSFIQLRATSGSAGGALKALGGSLLGGGGLVLGFSLLSSALQFAVVGLDRWKLKQKEAKEKQDSLTDSIVGQLSQVILLKSAFEQSERSLTDRKDIISQLNGLSDKYFGNLKAETATVEQLKKGYEGYVDALIQSFAVKQLEADLEPLVKRLAVAQSTVKRLGDQVKDLNLAGITSEELRKLTNEQRAALAKSGIFEYRAAVQETNEVWAEINAKIENATVLFSKQVKSTSGSVKEQTDILKNYRDELAAIDFREQATGIDLLREKINLATKTFEDFLSRGLSKTSKEFQFINNELTKFINQLPQLGRDGGQSELLPIQDINDVIEGYDKLIAKNKEFKASTLPDKATKTSSIFLTPETAAQQVELLEQLRKKQEQIAQFQQLSRDLVQGIASDFANVFTTVSNDGSNAFQRLGKAIEETTKRILIQFAVTKALTLLLNAIAPGSGSLAGVGSSGTTLRGTDLQLLIGRGG